MQVHGQVDARFERVRDAFVSNFEAGDDGPGDVGASCAVSVDGEFVVDIWAGHRDAAATLPWERDTIVNVYSTTKTMTALCALLLADRGELDFDAPVARYWPEFAANGKSDVRVAHLMSHSSGLSGFEPPVGETDLYDWDAMVQRLAAQAPWWPPGTASGYHAITQGYLVGEVVRRITGSSLGRFFADELAGPLGADFHIGLDPAHFDRVAELLPPPLSAEQTIGSGDADSIAVRTINSAPVDPLTTRTAGWRQAEIPAANGHGNARSVAAVQTLVANGGEAFGRRLLSAEGVERIFEEQISGTDLVLGVPLRFGLGYGLTSDIMPMGPNPRTCFWGGYGGSSVVADRDARVCIAYVMNRMYAGALGDRRGFGIAQAVFASLADA